MAELAPFFPENNTPQKQSNDQGLKKATETERNGGARTITVTMEVVFGGFYFIIFWMNS